MILYRWFYDTFKHRTTNSPTPYREKNIVPLFHHTITASNAVHSLNVNYITKLSTNFTKLSQIGKDFCWSFSQSLKAFLASFLIFSLSLIEFHASLAFLLESSSIDNQWRGSWIPGIDCLSCTRNYCQFIQEGPCIVWCIYLPSFPGLSPPTDRLFYFYLFLNRRHSGSQPTHHQPEFHQTLNATSVAPHVLRWGGCRYQDWSVKYFQWQKFVKT